MTDGEWAALGLDSGEVGAYDALYEGIPAWMSASFWGWVRFELTAKNTYTNARNWHAETVKGMERACRFSVGYYAYDAAQGMDALRSAVQADPSRAVRVADFLLADKGGIYGRKTAEDGLEKILRESGSAWTVGKRLGRVGLERRVPQGVQDVADSVMRSGRRAGERLAQAWSAVFGVDPNPSNGYSLAIKAVEDAAIPVLLPNDQIATLGKIIHHMRDVTYTLPFEREPQDAASGLVLRQMSQLLWVGQVDRHGGGEEAAGTVSQAAAEAAVMLAVPLVQWFTSGVVQRA